MLEFGVVAVVRGNHQRGPVALGDEGEVDERAVRCPQVPQQSAVGVGLLPVGRGPEPRTDRGQRLQPGGRLGAVALGGVADFGVSTPMSRTRALVPAASAVRSVSPSVTLSTVTRAASVGRAGPVSVDSTPLWGEVESVVAEWLVAGPGEGDAQPARPARRIRATDAASARRRRAPALTPDTVGTSRCRAASTGRHRADPCGCACRSVGRAGRRGRRRSRCVRASCRP